MKTDGYNPQEMAAEILKKTQEASKKLVNLNVKKKFKWSNA